MLALSFRPKLVECLRQGYSWADLAADLAAGITVGIVALPLAMAFAIASGLTPQAGIYTSIVAGFLISALGGSRVQIGGPTGAYIVIVYGIVARYGAANLAICTLAAGVILAAMGVLRLGGLIRFIPVSIVIGFTNGIALLILLSQVKDFLGLAVVLPDEFFTRLRVLATHASDANVPSLVIGALCLVALLAWPKSVRSTGDVLAAAAGDRSASPGADTDRAYANTATRATGLLARAPGPIVVLLIVSLACTLAGVQIETIGTRFGGVPTGLPDFALPAVSLQTLRDLIAPTITIALLGAIESLLSARVADSMIGDRHDPNQELVAQGIANIAAPLFGGIPATGAIARTATNVRAGARSPIAGMVHALTLLAIVLAAAPLARYIPLPALSAVLIVVALNMGDWKAFVELRRYSIPYRVVLLSTFAITVAFDLSTAVEIGLVLASLFFIYRVSDLTRIERIADADAGAGIAAFSVFGALFFGSVAKLEPLFDRAAVPERFVVLDMHQAISVDNTVLETLEALRADLVARGGALVLCALNPHPEVQVRRSAFGQALGAGNVQADFAAAMARARALAGAGSI
ncbi:MAG TPA: SulP family inorganic anion transporter [Casimicrobiaceae bacterium]|nr:SulP family inorganic anion transporter [Casimicrobiaceae bacterium]